MTLNFYDNLSENNAISKRLENPLAISNAVARNPLDVVNPEILLEYAGDFTKNYAYIPGNGRYYFITGIEKTRNGFYTLRLRCDVLMSFAEGILSQKAIIERANGVFDAYLHDEKSRFEAYSRTVVKNFMSAGYPVALNYDTSHAILITAG